MAAPPIHKVEKVVGCGTSFEGVPIMKGEELHQPLLVLDGDLDIAGTSSNDHIVGEGFDTRREPTKVPTRGDTGEKIIWSTLEATVVTVHVPKEVIKLLSSREALRPISRVMNGGWDHATKRGKKNKKKLFKIQKKTDEGIRNPEFENGIRNFKNKNLHEIAGLGDQQKIKGGQKGGSGMSLSKFMTKKMIFLITKVPKTK